MEKVWYLFIKITIQNIDYTVKHLQSYKPLPIRLIGFLMLLYCAEKYRKFNK